MRTAFLLFPWDLGGVNQSKSDTWQSLGEKLNILRRDSEPSLYGTWQPCLLDEDIWGAYETVLQSAS